MGEARDSCTARAARIEETKYILEKQKMLDVLMRTKRCDRAENGKRARRFLLPLADHCAREMEHLIHHSLTSLDTDFR